ncbi:YihY family inner membrane protein [Reinekea marina]|uniref:YihY family inner membrane protein n=1 Tax=Reinekea marina TaxID=1310421 RepID=A0ABV7WTT6_9GAMM|nr:YihY family inner membrane protein [Reinekea marina]MDN3649741.1 YihY family inner membrane protein [Reinekea marina]
MKGIGRSIQVFLNSNIVAKSHIGQHSAVLTLATLFALVPIAFTTVWLISQLPVYQSQIAELLEQFLSQLVPEQAISWRERLEFWQADSTDLPLSSFILLIASVLFLVNRVDHSLHEVFALETRRGKRRWLHYVWVMPALMSLLVASMTAIVVFQIILGTGLGRLLPSISIGAEVAQLLVLFFVYRLASRRSIAARWVFLAALLATLGFMILKAAFSWFYTNIPNWSLVFGVFYAIPLFLLWCQAAWATLLYGALFARWISKAAQKPQ